MMMKIMDKCAEANKADGPDKNCADLKKGKMTRRKILQAASRVFTRYPFDAASMRMIAKEGGFDHPIIHYYFPSKAKLFEAVMMEVCEEWYRSNIKWFTRLKYVKPKQGLDLFIDGLIDYNIRHPELLRIFAMNLPQADRINEVPGYQHIPELLARTREEFHKTISPRASAEEVGMFVSSFNSLVMYFLGAGSCQAQILGMEVESREYFTWVKNTLMLIFLPALKKLVYAHKKENTTESL